MRPLSTAELLGAWELGLNQSPAQWALSLLSYACPDVQSEELADLSIGQRDARLLTLREWTFGSCLVGLTTCPVCRERLELNLQMSDLRKQDRSEEEKETTKEFSFVESEYKIAFRLPNSLDLLAISNTHECDNPRYLLFQRCILDTQCKSEKISVDQLPDHITEKVVEKMAQADPQSNIQLDISCPSCNQQWQVIFDIVSFFWNEINAWAHRILREVHILASAYGWREADILVMSPSRRQLYIEMVNR